MRKKAVSILLCLCMAAMGVMACSSSTGDTPKASNAGQESVQVEESNISGEGAIDYYGYDSPVTIKVGYSALGADFTWPEGQDSSNNDWVELYKEHNIIQEILYEVDPSQSNAKLSAAIMSGDYPDILEADAAAYVNYVNTGVIADITEAYEKYASDELKEYFNADGGLALQTCYINGRLYGLPKMNSVYDFAPVMFIRQDWLDRLNLKIPQTMEELKEVALAFTYNDPDGNGADDTYGLAMDGVDVLNGGFGDVNPLFQCFGAYPGSDAMNFMDDGTGKVVWGGENTEGMKAALSFLSDLYKEGAVTKEFITMNGDLVTQEIGAGRCGIWFGPMWAAMDGAGRLMKETPEAHIVSSPIPDGTGEGENKTFIPNTFTTAFCVSSKCKTPEVIIKLMNLSVKKLCHPESNEEYTIYYGGKDEDGNEHAGWRTSLTWTLEPLKNYDNYLKDQEALESGDFSQLNAEQLNDCTAMKKYLDALESGDYGEDNENLGGVGLYTVFGDPQGSYAALDKLIQEDGYIASCFQGMKSEEMSQNSPILKKMLIETCIQIITGQQDVDSYDTFLENWKLNGGTAATEEVQAWYDENK